jgi:hypothetical protein
MPVHDWTKVDAGIFHDFHQTWIIFLKQALNGGVLPPDYYALAEQIAGGWGPDVLTLERPGDGRPREPVGGVALSDAPPKVRFRGRTEPDTYVAKANAVVLRHASDHRVVAVLEIVSPGKKSSRHALNTFIAKAIDFLHRGVHLLIVDLFPPGTRDPGGLHKAIWDELLENDFALPDEQPLALASYIGGTYPEAFIEPLSVGQPLADMPLFLTPDVYVPAPLESGYQLAWQALPEYWRSRVGGKDEG